MARDLDARDFFERVRLLKWEFFRSIEPHRPALYRYCRRWWTETD